MIRHRDGADYAIVYNGEIYNTDELIPELTSEQKQGVGLDAVTGREQD